MKTVLLLLIFILLSQAEEVLHNQCQHFSPTSQKIILLIESDGYNKEELKRELTFFKHPGYNLIAKDVKPVDTLIIKNAPTISFKRIKPLEKMEGNWYPAFNVTEICFTDSITAAGYRSKITSIIEASDIRNEKFYDYVIQNKNRLIYVCAYAKIWEEYAFSYRDEIQKLIKTDSL